MMADYHDNNGILFIAALMLFLWTARYKAPDTWLHSWAFVPMLVASTVGIFFACIAIDSVRDRLFRLLRVNDRIDTLFAKIKPKNNAI